jgi:phosphate-selective porin OprO/OprP
MRGWPVPGAIAACLLAASARAQEPSPVPSPSPKPVEVHVTADNKEGFSIASDDGAFVLQFRALAQVDARFYPGGGGEDKSVDTFEVRRLRPSVEGVVARRFEFQFVPDFGEGAAVLEDGYVDAIWTHGFRTRVGRFKTPVGLERLSSDSTLFFTERSLTQNLVASRDVGLMVHGEVAHDRVLYQAGVFNGTPDRRSGDADTNDAKDVAGRVFVSPLRGRVKAENGLSFGVAGSWGEQSGALPTYQTSGQLTFFTYAPDAEADGTRYRITPQASFYRGPLRGLAEYVRSVQDIARGETRGRVANSAADITAAWIVTGESARFTSPIPRRPFLQDGGMGAWEIAVRVHRLDVDDAAFTLGFADPAAMPRAAEAFGLGVNWYLNRNARVSLTYDHTRFEGEADRPVEHCLRGRFQLTF